VESINNHLVEGLVNTRTSTSIMAIIMIHGLGIMHLVMGLFYRTTFGVVIQLLGRINETCKGWNDSVHCDIHDYKHRYL
jgi:hypothetical protein